MMTRSELDALEAEATENAETRAHGYAYAETPQGKVRCRFQRVADPYGERPRFRAGAHYSLNSVRVPWGRLLSA